METYKYVILTGWLNYKGPAGLINLEGKGDKSWAAYALNKLKYGELRKKGVEFWTKFFKLFVQVLCLCIYV